MLQLPEGLGWNDDSTVSALLSAGSTVNPPHLLFEKIEDEAIEAQIQKLEHTKSQNQSAINTQTSITPAKESFSFDEFSKADLRVGTIVAAEKMPKADKLLILQVDTGLDTRTIVSGIAESFSPEEIINQCVTVLVNLAPRKLRGVESQGMILMTTDASGKLQFVVPAGGNVPN